MARQVLPIAGAVIGSFFGMPQLGFAIGSIIGNAVDPMQVKGPSIGDIAVQTSRDGVPRPIVFGVAAVFGNIIDRSEPKIVKKKERQGKGGPETVTEHVYMSFAIRICEGPITSISRIWENEKLIYDGGDTVNFPIELGAIGKVLGGASLTMHGRIGATIYLGGETQLPDPTFEAIHGVGNTPAYRGTAYIVFKDKDLTEFGGAIPQYRFEVDKSILFPTGNVWLTYDASGVQTFLGFYNGAPWSSVATGLPSSVLDGKILRIGDRLYISSINNVNMYTALISDLTSWTAISKTDGNALIGAFDSNYIYFESSTGVVRRMTLPTGSISTVSVSGTFVSSLTSLCIKNGVIYGTPSNIEQLSMSSDSGVNWTSASGNYGGGGGGNVTTDGTILVFVKIFGIDNKVRAKVSYDNGGTWSTGVIVGAAGDQIADSRGATYHDGKWVIIFISGACAYSSDAITWTAGATVPRNVVSVSFGTGRIVVGCEHREHYYSDNHGASWTLMGSPVATGTVSNILYTRWIGESE